MATPMGDMYAAANAIMATVNAAASTTVAQAPTNYGTDFRITPGSAAYQVQITPEKDYGDSNSSYPRAIVTVLIHHYVSSLMNEEYFLFTVMSLVADNLLVASVWQAQTKIFDLQRDIDPEIEDGGRVGNVITFEVSAVVLADAV
jgi:hypothetical protein